METLLDSPLHIWPVSFYFWAKYRQQHGKNIFFSHKIFCLGLKEAFQSQGRAPVGVLSSVRARAVSGCSLPG